ncbi:MAG: LuxR C-terminal-related transcriptional regulator, partial [Thermodesulfobacteriota bacterium]
HIRAQSEIPLAKKPELSARNEVDNISLIVMSSSTLVLEGIYKILEPEKHIEIIAVGENHFEVIPLIEHMKPDVLLVDTALPKVEILEVLEYINDNGVKTNLILLLHTLDENFVINAISSGVRGCITDTLNKELFIQAIRSVCEGEIWAERKVITRILSQFLPSRKVDTALFKPKLTKKEQEIVKLVIQSSSNKQISQKLFISQTTVKTHLSNIYNKLGVHNRHQLTVKFLG